VASSPEQLYDAALMRHARSPTRRGRLAAAATHHADGRNRPCGDTITLEVRVADDHIEAIRFEGEGCALSMAAASALCDTVEGATLAEARRAIDGLRAVMGSAPGREVGGELVGELTVLTSAQSFPSRHGCVLLAAEILDQSIAD